ncbi:MAG: hypothetical protein KTR32_22810 [Granulosicoccus sp.]|nr:hypothetical protein [Granulosicoccus sp.]
MITTIEIEKYLATEILKEPERRIEANQDLLLSGLLDSLSVVRLVNFIEESCAISIPPEDVVVENFGTINNILAYIESSRSRA